MTSTVNQPISSALESYLSSQHVVTIAGQDAQGLWAANCFYVWSAEVLGFIVLSSLNTRHGQIMKDYPKVCGTVSDQTQSIAHLQGVQYTGRSLLLNGSEKQNALQLYYQKFPIARAKPAPTWLIQIDTLKMTNNRLVFGHKTRWQRDIEC
ncbi:hypothetical protein [Celerinatantimonas yamalensis]|uniref:Uncharacterized protein n=1 Tax=Celerinatantimonas yamalensis TaxID=559956 RepID=A0ABW9G3Q4_9GAMM